MRTGWTAGGIAPRADLRVAQLAGAGRIQYSATCLGQVVVGWFTLALHDVATLCQSTVCHLLSPTR